MSKILFSVVPVILLLRAYDLTDAGIREWITNCIQHPTNFIFIPGTDIAPDDFAIGCNLKCSSGISFSNQDVAIIEHLMFATIGRIEGVLVIGLINGFVVAGNRVNSQDSAATFRSSNKPNNTNPTTFTF